ncbi:PREDICTED: LETM1 domain-containing protein 1 isoform X2 [Vollenhovia emeryi]|uniref:LETM1 domain-containing protein 1 isoform X2 n=1 Tax=Vollenhovia emeryi TaxID=411798 RepID=UPI0005F50C7D|nr:PREDICTED: LETM1 domain-containing protein 1 isoform X2 [Vollenhovia emeryi]
MYKIISRTLVRKGRNTLEPLMRTPIQRGLVKAANGTERSGKVAHLKQFWFGKYINYIKNYERTLEQKFPRTMQVYRVFSVGSKDVYMDLKRFITARKKQTLNGVESLTREELQLVHTMPKDLWKLSPLFLLSAVPFTNYVIFPLALYFPRYLLTSHFWTLQQKLEFMLSGHKARLKHNRSLFRCMQAELKGIKNEALRIKWRDAIACLGSGTHPTTKNIVVCSKLFSGPPYSLGNLKRKHLKELLAIHGMSVWKPFKRRRLAERGMLILRMDRAIVREGGVKEMSNEAMRWVDTFCTIL